MDHKLLEITNPGEAGFPEKVNDNKMHLSNIMILEWSNNSKFQYGRVCNPMYRPIIFNWSD